MTEKRSTPNQNWMLYCFASVTLVAIFALLFFFLPKQSFIYGFLFRCWPIQILSSWLFLLGLIYWVQRYSFFRKEEEVFKKIKLPDVSISQEDAVELIKSMPEKYKNTLTLRRCREILMAFLYGEDIIRLNEELSCRDMFEVERGHLLLNSMRSIIPVIGFLGTVIGLSLGMVKFPDIGDSVIALKPHLKSFAASLSVAFDTTLLALIYTIIVILLASFLRHREEALVGKVDERARTLIGKIIKAKTSQNEKDLSQPDQFIDNLLKRWNEEISSIMERFFEKLISSNNECAYKIAEDIGRVIGEKFEGLKRIIHKPPQYQIIVQPLEKDKE